MPEFNLIGPTYTAAAGNNDCQRTVNLYPEFVESAMGKGKLSLECTPGHAVAHEFATLAGLSRISSIFEDGEECFLVACGHLWQFDGTTYTDRGALVNGAAQSPNGSDAISWASNGTQVLIAASDFLTVGKGLWLYTKATQTITLLNQATYPEIDTATQVIFLDGYFIAFAPVDTAPSWSQKFYISGLYNGLTWDPLDFGVAEGDPDRIIAMVADHKELWLFGRSTTEVFANTGNANFPFERIMNAFHDFGCLAPLSLAKCDNTLFWLGSDKRGGAVVYRMNGYLPVRVSNHAVETSLNAAGIDKEAIFAYSYAEAGHSFYVLTIPNVATWVFDSSTQMWHERGMWNPIGGAFIPLPFVAHAYYKQKHYVCGPNADPIAPAGTTNPYGLLYEQSLNIKGFAGQDVRRLRTAPHLSAEQAWQFYHQLQIDLETQGGAVVGPTITLSWSDDGGKTWSTEHTVTLPNPGAAGAQKFRAIWRRLGRGRDRVFRFYVEAQTKWSFINGYLQSTPGSGI